jgi:hypothetical protein
MTIKQTFEIFADYFQFYIQDDNETVGSLEDAWTQEAVDRDLAVAPYVVGIGTARNTIVPVTVEVTDEAPTGSLDPWDRINHCSISVPSGRLVIAGCTDYFPDAPRITVRPGDYQVRVFYANLTRLADDGLSGEDCYRIVLWPGEPCPVTVLKG